MKLIRTTFYKTPLQSTTDAPNALNPDMASNVSMGVGGGLNGQISNDLTMINQEPKPKPVDECYSGPPNWLTGKDLVEEANKIAPGIDIETQDVLGMIKFGLESLVTDQRGETKE